MGSKEKEAAAKRLRGTAVAGFSVAALATALWACLQPPLSLSGGPKGESSDGGTRTDDGAAAAISGLFTMSGCRELTFPPPDGEPRCVGTAPAKIKLILLAVGATSHRFQVTRAMAVPDGGLPDLSGTPMDGGNPDGGDSLLDEASSRADTPTVTLAEPGTYLVSLGVAGPGGTASSGGVIVVEPAALGARCDSDDQCDSGLHCLCGKNSASGTCPGGLGVGMCTQSCDGKACPMGSACMDLSRSIPLLTDGGVALDAWRQPICVPSCTSDDACRGDLICRELPILNAGESAGGSYTWKSACFASAPGGVGATCLSGDEKADPEACVLGLCEGLGLRNLCTASCSAASCPTSAACATWNGLLPPAPSGPRCLSRCDATHPCTDPLLDCLASGGSGGLGFTLPTGEPAGTTVCAPRRCTVPADCPGGRCVATGGASFCLR